MKTTKLVILSTILCFSFLFAQDYSHGNPAQQDWKLSVMGGLNRANLNTDQGQAFPVFGPYNESKGRMILGASLEKPISPVFSIQGGLFYVRDGAKSVTQAGTDETGNYLGDFYFMQDLRYLQVPISVKFNYTTPNLNSFVLIGPNFGILMSAKEKMNNEYDSPFEYDQDIADQLNTFNLGLDMGLGSTYQLSERFGIGFMLKYTLGLTNQIKDSISNTSQKTRDLQILIGPSYSF